MENSLQTVAPGNRTVPLSTEQLADLAKLLLNSWSAEYALRLTPLISDQDVHDHAMHWSFPQAYWSAYFSIRGVLLTLGCQTAGPDTILTASATLHHYGLYEGTTLVDSFLSDLRVFCQAANLTIYDPIAEQQRLLAVVDEIALAHEGYLLDQLGELYVSIVRAVPDYLQESFLSSRLEKLLADAQAVNWVEEQLSSEKEVVAL